MKKNIKKSLALLMCLIMLFAIVACNSSNGSTNDDSNTTTTPSDSSTTDNATDEGNTNVPVSAKDTLNIAVSGDNGTLVPSKIMGGFVGVVRQYMEPLVDFTDDGEPIWLLATDIEEVSTEKWIVHCREGVTFSNGNKFDANDVWFTLEYYLKDPTIAFYINCFDLEKSKIVDDYTIELALKMYEITQMGSLCQMYILDAESFDEDIAAKNPVGTGPYAVTEYVVNSHLYMEANENYWGNTANIKYLKFRCLAEASQMVNAIQTGLVDVSVVPNQDISYVESLDGFDVRSYHTGMSPTIMFNFAEHSPMSSLEARLAVCYAVNRQSIIDISYSGTADLLAYPASMHCLDYEDRFANMHDTYATGQNLDLARQYAESSGLVGKELVIITNGAAEYATEAELIQADLLQIGVNAVINNYDPGSYWTIQGDPSMFDIALYAVASPQMFASGILLSYVEWGAAHYAQTWDEYDEYYALCKATVSNPDPVSRSDMLYEMSEMFVNIIPWFGVCDTTTTVAINSDLGGVDFWVNGGMRYFEWYWKS